MRKTIALLQLVQATTDFSWDVKINVPFNATSVTVRQMGLDDDGKGNAYVVQSNIVPEGVLGIVADDSAQHNPASQIDLQGENLQGSFNIRLTNSAGNQAQSVNVALFSLVLEFSS